MATEEVLAGRTYSTEDAHPAYLFGAGMGLAVGGVGSILGHNRLMAAGYATTLASAYGGYRSAKKHSTAKRRYTKAP